MTVLIRVALAAAASIALLSCGSPNSESNEPPGDPTPNYVRLMSQPGDYIGLGQSYEYSQANALLTVTSNGGQLGVTVVGDETWTGSFVTADPQSRLEPGTYTGLERGTLEWTGEGRGCNEIIGTVTITSVRYTGDQLSAIDLQFEQHCERQTPALRGTIHWNADDPTTPPGPTFPIPTLWQPTPGETPMSGSYVYLKSQAGDYVGQGLTLTYTPTSSAIAVQATGRQLTVNVSGTDSWHGTFEGMLSIDQLQAGYYPELQRWPFNNPAKGGLAWSGNGRGCNTLQGWFAIDNVSYLNGQLVAIDLRFEQHCEGGTPALFGKIHWVQ